MLLSHSFPVCPSSEISSPRHLFIDGLCHWALVLSATRGNLCETRCGPIEEQASVSCFVDLARFSLPLMLCTISRVPPPRFALSPLIVEFVFIRVQLLS